MLRCTPVFCANCSTRTYLVIEVVKISNFCSGHLLWPGHVVWCRCSVDCELLPNRWTKSSSSSSSSSNNNNNNNNSNSSRTFVGSRSRWSIVLFRRRLGLHRRHTQVIGFPVLAAGWSLGVLTWLDTSWRLRWPQIAPPCKPSLQCSYMCFGSLGVEGDWSDFCHWGFTSMATLDNPRRCLVIGSTW